MMIDKFQIISIRTLISHLGLDKDEVILQASGGRTESTKELTKDEARELIGFLRNYAPKKQDKANLMRRKIISCCHEMRMYGEVPGRVDMLKVDALVMKVGYKKPKKLMEYTEKELPTLVTQIEKIRDHYLTKVK